MTEHQPGEVGPDPRPAILFLHDSGLSDLICPRGLPSPAVFRCPLPAPLWMRQTPLPRGPGPGV